MLHEIVGLADEPPAKRRWFHDEFFDLFVWQTLNGELTRFQLCYGIHSSERALVWQRQGGFFLDGLRRDSTETLEGLLGKFNNAAPTLPKMIRQTVGARLHEFAKIASDIQVRRREFRRASWQKRLPSAERKTG